MSQECRDVPQFEVQRQSKSRSPKRHRSIGKDVQQHVAKQQLSTTSADVLQEVAKVKGVIHGRSVFVSCSEASPCRTFFEERCFGSWSKLCDGIILSLEEALFVQSEYQVLEVDICSPQHMGHVDQLFSHCCELVSTFSQRYAAYWHLRNAGWIVRPEALKFGADFLLYRGRPSEVHAEYAVLVGTTKTQWRETLKCARLAHAVGKDLLLVFFLNEQLGSNKVLQNSETLGEFLKSSAASITQVVTKCWHAHQG